MRTAQLCLFAFAMLLFSGCTEMRVEGDAKVFQSSAIGSIIRVVMGLALIGMGLVALIGSVWPDKKPKNRMARPSERLSTGQRFGLALFGFSMGFAGLFLSAISLLFPNKLHVSVYPDRVSMASTFSQTGGKEVVVPFSDLSSVELRDERKIVGRYKTFLVLTLRNGNIIRQEAGNNERQAVETIQQALAEYQKSAPVVATAKDPLAPNTTEKSSAEHRGPGSANTSGLKEPPANAPDPVYTLKRYAITSPIPAGYALVAPKDPIEVGAKLKACFGGSWYFVTVVAVNADGTITCNWDDWKSYTYKMVREDLVSPEPQEGTLIAKAPPTPPSFSPPPSSPSIPSQPPTSSPQTSTQYTLKRYKITIPIPKGSKLVGAETEVQVGSKLQACYAGHWEFVTVVAINDDGTITCNWDNWKGFTYKMMREDLIHKGR